MELLSDLGTVCPPPLIEAASSDVDSVFVNVGVLIVQTYLGCFGGKALSIFCFTSTTGGHFRPKSIGLGNHEAEMLLLVSPCKLHGLGADTVGLIYIIAYPS